MDVERQNLAAGAVEEKCVGLAGLEAEQIDAPGAAHHRIDNVGTGNQRVARVGIELHDRRFVEPERHALMHRPAMGCNGDKARIVIGRCLRRGGRNRRPRQT